LKSHTFAIRKNIPIFKSDSPPALWKVE